jgi:integrase
VKPETAKRRRHALPKYLTADQIDRLLSVIDSKRDRAMFAVAYFYGLRASEVGLLDISDWRDSRVGVPKLNVHRLKGSEDGCFGLPDEFLRYMRAWIRDRGDDPGPLFPSQLGGPVSRQTCDVLMRKYCERAGIGKHESTGRTATGPVYPSFHWLKHSICTNLLEAGEPITDVQQHVGHRSINNTMIYTRITGKSVAAREKRLKTFHRRGRR